MGLHIDDYRTEGFFDEMFVENSVPREAADLLIQRLQDLSTEEIRFRQQAAEAALYQMGITFAVYGSEAAEEKIFPFDIIPRIIDASDWQPIENGLKQRVTALNLFIDDIYHDQRILKEGIIPPELIRSCAAFRPECVGIDPPNGTWCHISGVDLIRDGHGVFHVLEDNLRSPSGVSYVLENREVLKHTFPRVFGPSKVRPVEDYPNQLLHMLEGLAPAMVDEPSVAVLTPGVYNSAYFEHSFLAKQMGVRLVEGRDLVTQDGFVYARTTRGFEKIDVIYRRIDDDFLDPLAFRPDSMLGVPGIMDSYRRGMVALANAPGCGVADDKAVYAYVPKIIKFYLNEEPIIPNVPTYVCWNEDDRQYVLEHIDQLVVKAVNESGGYGMLIGPHASAGERAEFVEKIKANPRNYIGQPTLSLSRAPIIAGDRVEGRHVDLRPYILFGSDIYVLPGGLTRVALKKGSLVVNSSQGGGSKDTWVVDR
ncbi:MAG: circularly permuted type 2 ATP-grasp protein [Nitrospinota bacterium]|nr:circularly permuted type 2 ATP-grasp protein [Nitrospinota bacterium]MDH5755828.1 circularly permuted type 2 ATP-grasp protein [Nitrospinota bacterium]